jgi:hypothetical protein
MVKEKQRIIDEKEYIAKRIEDRKQAMIDRPSPYQREIETCDHLIAYCNRLKIQFGLTTV